MQEPTRLHPATSPLPAAPTGHRFKRIMDLTTYDAVGLAHSGGRVFEEQVRFGPMTMSEQAPCPAEALAERIEAALVASSAMSEHVRPLHVSAPLAALAHPDTAAACDAAIRRARACPQEICLEFEDCAFAQHPSDAISRVRTLRRHGLRVGVDARRAWTATTNLQLRMLLDSVRIDVRMLAYEPDLVERLEAARFAGMAVIGDYARWRDADELLEAGVTLATRPRADA